MTKTFFLTLGLLQSDNINLGSVAGLIFFKRKKKQTAVVTHLTCLFTILVIASGVCIMRVVYIILPHHHNPTAAPLPLPPTITSPEKMQNLSFCTPTFGPTAH